MTRGVCLADLGREYWIYLPEGGTTELPQPLGTDWRGEWLRPEGMAGATSIEVEVEGRRSFTTPKQLEPDSVLHLVRR